MDGQGTKCRRNIAENFDRLSRVHERYRRQTDGRQHMANVNVSSRSLKTTSKLHEILCACYEFLWIIGRLITPRGGEIGANALVRRGHSTAQRMERILPRGVRSRGKVCYPRMRSYGRPM